LFAVISGGLTGLLQPCDVVWFKQLKSSIAEKIDQWKARPVHDITRNGNVRAPGIEDMSTWLSDAWNGIRSDTIAGSFKSCFLGDSLYLHIAKHALYGDQFRMRIAQMTDDVTEPDISGDMSEENSISEIDDE
jgi:hypothetical protein